MVLDIFTYVFIDSFIAEKRTIELSHPWRKKKEHTQKGRKEHRRKFRKANKNWNRTWDEKMTKEKKGKGKKRGFLSDQKENRLLRTIY